MQPYSLFTYPPPYDKWAVDTDVQVDRVVLRFTVHLVICSMVWLCNFLVWFANIGCPQFHRLPPLF